MAESSGQEKTEQATPKKLQQARDKGQVPRSKELATAAVLIASAASMYIFGSAIAMSLYHVMKNMFTIKREQAFDTSQFGLMWAEVFTLISWPLLGFIITLFIFGFIGSTTLGGITFSFDAARPKLSKMSPVQGFKRMFGTQALVELLKSLGKFAVISTLAWLLLTFYFPSILQLSQTNFPLNVIEALDILLWIFIILCSSLLLIAVIDAPYQIFKHKKELKMTLQEVKDEFKNTEGKPEVKGRQRQLQREVSQRRMMQDVPDADVVITNPTHFSVALKYDTEGSRAPIVVAKGVDQVAFRIREVARENNVSLVASPALARAIYHTTEIDEQIPDGLFGAVAQVLAYVFQLEQFQKRKGRRPTKLPNEFDIPDDLKH
ncbi:flagellar biosynthesis protein FlhB [Psychrobium sp. 1_MG-2023]|uniref:flagellar biosynthesis protein FlhB n=1 Tax=Psychrobium sp. 1_MG-2023 TaxID=3062624 RepID=UPI000C332A7D|nr:flagellar biosynthesis protein FlhB [Psychrobium sp. 1_MG-2023]MDP2559825.1 flagellar biosynthesis protein FlhB [Psychrobium sp. 1_MG-2023]PKF59071.1 flagellar biosynthesis protein FlhB [Alteromonadales bacterium alter-6D02]